MPTSAHRNLARFARGELDATPLTHQLYQGGAPPPGASIARAGFHTLVLCAEEYQDESFPDVQVIRAPNDDALRPPTRQELVIAFRAANAVADRLAQGQKVLVTCAMGWNRSGLVSALALRRVLGISGSRAMQFVQKKRPRALSNKYFCDILRALPAPV